MVRRALGLVLVLTVAAAAPVSAGPLRAGQVEWIEVPYGGGTMLAAVARPTGVTDAPLVVVLHGSAGFRQSLVAIAESFAREGFVALAGCWFAGAAPGSTPAADAIPCPTGPPFAGATTESAAPVRALVAAGRRLAGVRADRIGLFGHSRGATAALLAASTGESLQAVVAVSPSGPRAGGGTDTNPADVASGLAAPVLLLHGTADTTVPVQATRAYEQALRALGKEVEARYYDGGGHELPFAPATAADVLSRASAFFTRHLGRATVAPDTSPVVTLAVPAGQRLATVLVSGLRVSAGCSEACALTVTLSKGARRLATASAEAAAGRTVNLRLKPSSGLHRGSLTVAATGTDAAGNTGTARRTVSIR
jgi:carboxymethylenebutenolidase